MGYLRSAKEPSGISQNGGTRCPSFFFRNLPEQNASQSTSNGSESNFGISSLRIVPIESLVALMGGTRITLNKFVPSNKTLFKCFRFSLLVVLISMLHRSPLTVTL